MIDAPRTPADADAGGPDRTPRRLISETQFRDIYRDLRDRIELSIELSGRWAIVGVKRRGAVLARRLWNDLKRAYPDLLYGEVDISLYRDDYHLQTSKPRVLGTEITFSVEGCSIVLVDDVLFTGRTVRAAIDQLLDFGRPRRIWLAVFVDRGHRELPIEANYVGHTIGTRIDDRVVVLLRELGDPVDAVDLIPGRVETS